ncbi:MAG: dTDP-4-dehydrorhamnose reductase, partial [Pedobacter sp.]
TEADEKHPLNVFGESKAMQEDLVLAIYPQACIIRSSGFFGPFDEENFVARLIASLQKGEAFEAAGDIFFSPTYLPHLVHHCLDLLVDGSSGIWHMVNEGAVSWARFARLVTASAGLDLALLHSTAHEDMGYRASRPAFTPLATSKGITLPMLQVAINDYLVERSVAVPKAIPG